MSTPLWSWTASDLATAIRARKIKSREAVDSVLDRIAAAPEPVKTEVRKLVGASKEP